MSYVGDAGKAQPEDVWCIARRCEVAAASLVSARSAIGAIPGVALTQPTDPGMGILTPTPTAAQTGMWGAPQPWSLIGLHTAVLPNGNVVTYGSPTGELRPT